MKRKSTFLLTILLLLSVIAYIQWHKSSRHLHLKSPESVEHRANYTKDQATGAANRNERKQAQNMRAQSLKEFGLASNKAEKDDNVPLTPDQKILKEIEELVDNDNVTEALKKIETVIDSPAPDVRRDIVELCGWIGVKALPTLSRMLGDEDSEVNAEAFENWEFQLEEITDEYLKAEVLTAGIKLINSQEAAESAIMHFESVPDDAAVLGLVSIIEEGTSVASEVAYEHYEFVTDEKYTSPEAAERWIIENVEVEEPETVPMNGTK